MSWIRQMTFWCDTEDCNGEITYLGGGDYPAELATRAGWKVFLGDDAGLDLCPRCNSAKEEA